MKQLKKTLFAILPFIAILIGCNNGSNSIETPIIVPIQEEPEEEPAKIKTALENSEEFLNLFKYGNDVKINITISKEALAFISNNQLSKNDKYSDFYVPCDFTLVMNGVAYNVPETGIRLKGNTSRGNIVNSSNQIENYRHYKLSFKETFADDEYKNDEMLKPFYKKWDDKEAKSERKDRTLFDMKKLNLKYVPRNFLNGDSSTIRETFCYQMFEDAGILAPKSNLCTFSLNNGVSTKEGAYQIIEDIDKVFLKRRFTKDDAKGDLYKCSATASGWASLFRTGAVEKTYDENGYNVGKAIKYGKIGVDDSYNHNYVATYSLKTNDDDGQDSDFSNIERLINTIYNVNNAAGGNEMLESVLDIDQWCKFSAISYILGNFDDLRGNNNNYYLYFVPSTGKVIFIPYDYDWTLGLDCNCHCENWTPYGEEHQTGGEDLTSIFYITFLKNNKPGSNTGDLDKTNYIRKYGYYVSKYYGKILNPNYYKAFANEFSEKNNAETVMVEYYMNKKSEVIKREL